MTRHILLFTLLALWAVAARAGVRVVDAVHGTPVTAVTVTDASGNVSALADDYGRLGSFSPDAYPLTLKRMGYLQTVVTSPADTLVAMSPLPYELPEVVAADEARNVLVLDLYIRETSSLVTGSDTLTIVLEGLADAAFTRGKVKKFKGWRSPRILGMKYYARIVDGKTGLDSVTRDPDPKLMFMTLTDIIDLPDKPLAVPAPEEADTSALRIWRKGGFMGSETMLEISPSRVISKYDLLAGKKDHKWTPWFMRLMGITTDFTDWTEVKCYENTGASELGPADLLSMSASAVMKARGKLFKRALDVKEAADIRTYCEIYVTDRRWLTATSARELRDTPPAVTAADITLPAGVPPPDSPTLAIMHRAENAD